MAKLTVITPWIGAGVAGNPYRPRLGADHPTASTQDITGQACANLIPSVNLHILEVECSDATATAIKGNTNYLVLTDGATLNDGATLSSGQASAARTWLQSKGITLADLTGRVAAGMTRKQVRDALKALALTWKRA